MLEGNTNASENIQSEYDRLLQNLEKKVKNKVRNINSFARLKMEIPSAELLTVQNAIDKIEEEIKAYVKRDLSSAENDGNEVLGNRIKELRKKSDQLKLIQKLSDKGVRVNMYSASEANAEGIKTPNGVTIGDDIYININSTDPLSKTMGHEMLHLLKNENQEAYNNIIDLVKKGFPGENAEARISYLKEKYTEDYSDYYTLDNEMFWEEYAADVLGDMSDKNAYGRGILNEILNSDLSTDKKKTAVKAFAEGLRKLIIKVRIVIGKGKYRNYAEMQAYEFVNNAIEIHKEAAKAYRDLVEGRVSEGNKKTAAGAGVKYAVGKNRIVSYTEHEKKNWKKSNSIVVYESEEQFEKFVDEALNNHNIDKKIYFGKIPYDVAKMVKDNTGVDTEGYNIVLRASEIRKILLYSHGDAVKEANRGQEAITIDDLKQIPTVITNPDAVKLVNDQYEGKPLIAFQKTIDNKTYVISYVSRKHHDVTVQTMYKSKRSLATARDAKSPLFTSETNSSTASYDNTLSQEKDIVNRYSMQNEDVKYSAPASSAIEQGAELENHAYEIETAVIKRLEAALDTKLSEKTREAVKVYSISEAMGDHERISASREKLVDSIENNENPIFEERTEDDGFKDYLKGLKDKVYVSDYARQGMSAADVSRTFGVGKWSGKEGLPVDVLYDNMKADGITLPEADTLQDKLIALRDKKAEIREVRREAMPRSEIRDIVDYAIDLEDYTHEREISDDVEIPGLDGESKTVQDAEFMNKRREIESEISALDDNDYTQKRKLREEKNALERDFVEKLIRFRLFKLKVHREVAFRLDHLKSCGAIY